MINDIKIGVCYKVQWQAWYKWEILYEMKEMTYINMHAKKIWQRKTKKNMLYT